MTWSRQTTIWCDGDGCQEWVQYSGIVDEARSVAEETAGWDCSTDEDLCNECK